jgi:hypothetical protein
VRPWRDELAARRLSIHLVLIAPGRELNRASELMVGADGQINQTIVAIMTRSSVSRAAAIRLGERSLSDEDVDGAKSWFFLLPIGRNDPADPSKPGWGGQHEQG